MTTKILVIDDDKAITDLLGMLLKINGYEPITANCGRDGLRLAQETSPHIIILDLVLPDLHGQEVCKAIRTFSNAPIMILSSVNDPNVVAKVLDSGADDFLVKPVPSGTLIARVKKMLRRTNTPMIPKINPPTMPRSTTAPLHS